MIASERQGSCHETDHLDDDEQPSNHVFAGEEIVAEHGQQPEGHQQYQAQEEPASHRPRRPGTEEITSVTDTSHHDKVVEELEPANVRDSGPWPSPLH